MAEILTYRAKDGTLFTMFDIKEQLDRIEAMYGKMFKPTYFFESSDCVGELIAPSNTHTMPFNEPREIVNISPDKVITIAEDATREELLYVVKNMAYCIANGIKYDPTSEE